MPHPRNELFDAIVAAFGLNPAMRSVGSRVGKIVRDLTLANAQPQDAPRVIQFLASKWGPNIMVTPEAMLKHWCQAMQSLNAGNVPTSDFAKTQSQLAAMRGD